MTFLVGDYVMVLDEDLTGVITNINSDTITIETQDGFLMTFKEAELVKTQTNASLKKEMFDNTSINQVISEKEVTSRKKQPKIKVKERFKPTMEVDLHIHQLTNSTKGMTSHDMLNLQVDTARRQLEFAIRNRIQKVVFVHGVGEGVLKLELEYLFGKYNNVKFYDADYKKYGLGATEVYIFQNVRPNN